MSTSSDPICRRCHVSMVRGYCIDLGDANAHHRQEWTEGEPKQGRFLFMKYSRHPEKKDRIVVVTWRCPQCSLLESYAPRT